MNNRFVIGFQLTSICRRLVPLMLLFFVVVAARPEPARANDADTANVAVDLFVRGSQYAGLPLTTTEAEIVKQIVICGLSGTETGSCVRNIAVATAMKQLGTSPDMTTATNCLLDGKPAKACVDAVVVGHLPEEARPMVSCMISGQDNIADCAKKFAEAAIINKVPEDFRPAATCIIETGNAATCAKNLIIQQVTTQLPPDMRDQANTIVNCLGSGNPQSCIASAAAPEQIKPLVACATAANANVGQCMADFAAKDLPDGVAKDMVGCIGQGADFGKCAAQKGIAGAADVAQSQISKAQQDAIQNALALIDRLRPDAPYTIEPGRNGNATIKNILMVADGIKRGDWLEFTTGAGPELVKIAGSVILSIFLTPALAGVLNPAWEAMVNNDVAAAQRALDAASKGDAVAFAQTVFEWYENSFIDKPCALIGSGADGACQAMSNTIKMISDSGADLAKKLLAMGKDVLEWLGIWGTIDDVATFGWNTLKDTVTKVGQILGIGSDEWKAPADCASPSRESPSDYLANHVLACLPKTASAAVSGRNADTTKLTADCNAYFNRCTDPKKRGSVAEMCSAMSGSLSNMTSKVSDSMAATAKAYTDSGIGMAIIANEANKDWLSSGGVSGDLCAADFWKANQYSYAAKCAAFVNGAFPLAPTNTAAGATNACPALPTASGNSAQQQACIAALNAASAAQKSAMAGPNSDLCKQQKQYVADHPCTVETRTMTVPGSGMKFNEIKNIKCSGGTRAIGSALLEIPKLPDVGGVPRKKKPRTLTTMPGYRDRSYRPDVAPLQARRMPNHGSRSAMDTLGDTILNNGLNNVAGSAGGPALSHIPNSRSAPSGTRSVPNTRAGRPLATNNRPGNIGSIRPRNGGNTKPASQPDDLTNYGGCACDQKDDNHVR